MAASAYCLIDALAFPRARRTATLLLAGAVAMAAAGSQDASPTKPESVRVVIRADAPGASIPRTLWGHALPASPAEREAFFLAELLPNRSFEAWPAGEGDDAASIDRLVGWVRGDGSIVERVVGPDPRSPGAIRLHGKVRSVGALARRPDAAASSGGFRVEAGARLLLRVDARRDGEAALRIRLRGDEGLVIAEGRIDARDLTQRPERESSRTPLWPRHGIPLTPRSASTMATLELETEGDGDVLIDLVSLVPASTWRGHGLRGDRAELVDALHPTLLALPWSAAAGDPATGSSTRRWRRTVGDIVTRPGHAVPDPAQQPAAVQDPVPEADRAPSTPSEADEHPAEDLHWSVDGLGLFETLQWAEDLDAETLVALDPDAVLEAAELIEFANGSQQSTEGSLRANGGHPAPFGLRYGMWIETAEAAEGARGSAPGLTPIAVEPAALATTALQQELARRSARSSVFTPVAPPTFAIRSAIGDLGLLWQRARLLDRESRDGPPLAFVAWGVDAPEATLDVALAEAAFLTSLERAAGRVAIAVHHGLLGSVAPSSIDRAGGGNPVGRAGLLLAPRFDGGMVDEIATLTTPAYWVHALHATHRGDRVLPVELPPLPLVTPTGGVGIGARGSMTEFRNIRVALADGGPELLLDRADAQPITGNWTRREDDGVQVIDASGDESALTLFNLPALAEASDYTLRLEARFVEGGIVEEGNAAASDDSSPASDAELIVAFHARDGDHHTAWVLAGASPDDAGRRVHALERHDRGRLRLGQGVPVGEPTDAQHPVPALQPGRWYALEIVCSAGRVRCSIDGMVIHDLDERQAQRIATSATLVERTGEVILCAVNATEEATHWSIEVPGIERIARGELSVLSGPDLDASNTAVEPQLIEPVRSRIPPGPLPLSLTLPPRSVSFLRLLPAESP